VSLIALLGSAQPGRQAPASPSSLNRIQLTANSKLAKTDLLSVANLESYAKENNLDFFQTDQEIILIDRSLFKLELEEEFRSFKNLIEGMNTFPQGIDVSRLPADQAKALKRFILRSPFGGAYSQRSLDSSELKVGVKLILESTFTTAGISKKVKVDAVFPSSLEKEIDNPNLPFGQNALLKNNLLDEPEKTEPIIATMVSVSSSRSSNSALMAKASTRLQELALGEEVKARKLLDGLAESALGSKTPTDGTEFSELPESARSQFSAQATRDWKSLGFGSDEDAMDFMKRSRLSGAKVRLSLSLKVRRDGRPLIQAFSLDSIRF
jgi:hypothetical protein